MNISLIADELERNYTLINRIERNNCLALNPTVFYSRKISFSEGDLILARGASLPDPPPAINEDGAVFPENIAFICIGSAPAPYRQGNCDYLELEPTVSRSKVFNDIQAVYRDYSTWYESMLRSLINEEGIQALYDIALQKTVNPVFSINLHYEFLAYAEYPDLVETPNIYADEEEHSKAIFELETEPNVDEIWKKREPTLWKDQYVDFDTLYCNILSNGAKLGLVLIDGRARPIKRGDYVLLKIVRDLTELLLQKRSTPLIENFRVLEQLIRHILDGNSLDKAELARELNRMGWDGYHSFFLLLVSNENHPGTPGNLKPICNIIEHKVGNCCAFEYTGLILILVPNEAWNCNMDYYLSALAPILRENLLKAAASYLFEDFQELPCYYQQAHMALSYGRKSNSTNWVFRYEDYLLPYLLEHASGDMTLRTLCHPGLLKLIDYDRKNHLEYTKTLKTFVENNCSQSSTCRSMYIHRSTLLQRLSRINDLTGFDLEDADTRLYLLIFFSLSGATELI